jgi:hypothetical protein
VRVLARSRVFWLALLALAGAACVSPRTSWPTQDERDPAEVREEKRMRGLGAGLEAAGNRASSRL